MRFVIFCGPEGKKEPGVMPMSRDVILPLAHLFGEGRYGSLLSLIQDHSLAQLVQIQEALEGDLSGAIPLGEVRLTAPIGRPIHDVLCVGLNYADHIRETRGTFEPASTTEKTVYFGKRAVEILGPGEPIHAHASLDEELDYEAELAVILGRTGRDIAAAEASEYIFGYSVLNDVSARQLQSGHKQWLKGKSLDGFCVMGPWIVHRSVLPLPLELPVRSQVNAELRQNGNTRQMIKDVPHILEELSQGMTLEAGDIIATGTPAGVGMGFTPKRFMKAGDEICCEVQGIGMLCNKICD